MAATFSYSPFERMTTQDMQELAQVLWSWSTCGECIPRSCTKGSCPNNRMNRLEHIFRYYRALLAGYDSDSLLVEPRQSGALRSYDDLYRVLEYIKMYPEATKAELLKGLFADSIDAESSIADQEQAVNLALRIMLMVNCCSRFLSLGLLESGMSQITWKDNVGLSQYISDIFPMTDHPSLNDGEDQRSPSLKNSLTALKLKKRAGLRFQGTNYLTDHLKLDRKTGVVEVFHHTAFLKEHLLLTRAEPINISVSESLRVGALPRQLALEALDSIQKVLFPLDDPKSKVLLQSLVSVAAFDPDCLRFESAAIRKLDEKDIPYHYFGARLADLYEELQDPTPRGIERWFERKSGARYVMMATLIGVIIALILGIASLGVSVYQAWISYQAWKYPVHQ
ncbi:hypothetical protein PVAG01_10866 [Phlyctema vagabunda]|uniref:Uncharacterized protein n=1 Tax=Phlyctema vagabunda TaxID=108571 RepID=A0ABR4P3G5_9HELO